MFYSIVRNLLLIILLGTGILYVLYNLGFRLNISSSLPMGVWQISKLHRPLHKGDIVWFCPPDTEIFKLAYRRSYIPHGNCSNRAAHLLKPVAALYRDVVAFSEQGLVINDILIPNSKPKRRDALNRLLWSAHTGTETVQDGMMWVVSSYNSDSFDSRYFGSIPVSAVEGIAHPVFILH